MSELNYGDCIGCGLCILGCPAYEETGFDMLTARGRNKSLQAGLAAPEMVESIWACTQCGYCDAICPSDVHNVDIVLQLRRDLAALAATAQPKLRVLSEAEGRVEGSAAEDQVEGLALSEADGRVEGLARAAGAALVLGCTIRQRAPHLIPSIHAFLETIGRPVDASDAPSSEACCGSLAVETGHAQPDKVPAGVVADPMCFEQYDAEFLGALAMQHLELFDLETPFYYYAPNRLVNRYHAQMYPLYDELRRRFDCDINFDLNRLARSTSASSVQGLSGYHARDVQAAVTRLLTHSHADRIITCSPADYLAFKEFSGRDTFFITECLR